MLKKFGSLVSDVGGGYYRDGLADICLRYAIEWLIEQTVALNLLTSADINYNVTSTSASKLNCTRRCHRYARPTSTQSSTKLFLVQSVIQTR